LENAHNILFWDKRPPSSQPDVQALKLILEHSKLGILVLNTKDEVLFSTSSFTNICANNYFKTNFISLFKYEAAKSSPDTIIIKSEDNGSIEINASFIHWNDEKATLFMVKEIPAFRNEKQDEGLHIAMHLTESFYLPVMFFKSDVLVAANLRATERLGIDSNEFNRTNFAHLFDNQQSEKPTSSVENLLDAVTFKSTMRGNNSREKVSIVSRYVVLDGISFRMVQVLDEVAAKTSDGQEQSTAHDIMMMASHDLREPVRTVVNYAQLTLDKLKNGKYKQAYEYAELAASTALRMDKLLSDFKLMVSIDEKQLELQKVSLQSVLNAALTEAEKGFDKAQIEINIHKLPDIKGSEKLLIQLFKQLLDNAFKFKKGEKAIVEVAAEQEGESILICVRDNGIGLARKYKDKIFEPFQRLNRIDEYPGSGLGLTIAKKIAEKHNGKISIESMNGMGSSVYVTLPV